MLKIFWLAFQQSAAFVAIMLLVSGSTQAAVTAKTTSSLKLVTPNAQKQHPTLANISPQATSWGSHYERLLVTGFLTNGMNLAQANATSQELVKPTDWAYQALKTLSDRYYCFANYPHPSLWERLSLKRSEFAVGLNFCLDRIAERVQAGEAIATEDTVIIQRLQNEFSAELAAPPEPVDDVEANPAKPEQNLQSETVLNRPLSGQPPAPPPAVPRPIAPPLSDGYFTTEADESDRPASPQEFNREGYSRIEDNPFLRVSQNPLSTFSIDVDTASYSNVRRFIANNQLPPKDAVRIEELINYFTYNYPQPEGDRPFSITTEIAPTPWNDRHKLVQIGLKGKNISKENLPPSNLVFLIDTSGSMDEPNKLPLVKASMRLLVNELTEKDRVTIVVYAGSAGLVLPPTPGNEKAKILEAIDRLQAGGSTAGGAGIQLAYKQAGENYIKSGNNRVILATDGDFNVGISSDAELVRLIEEKREMGVFLTVLGYGTGNYQDAKMEQLANKGNGNYAYVDSLLEAKKVLVKEIGATLLTIAKDVKIQVEFNPAKVQAYRLIGYENRLLRNEDFNDDKKDAGELGAGHSVTALYEIIPTGVESDVKLPDVDNLRYQQTTVDATAYKSNELMQVKLRYKAPNATESQLIVQSTSDRNASLDSASENLKFAAAVAAFGMILRDSEYKGEMTFERVISLANQAKGEDREGYRAEFIRLVENSKLLASAKK